jgi:MYXO-CTERM domain-containing protein
LDDVAFTTSTGTPDPHPVETPVANPTREPLDVSGGGCACSSVGTGRSGSGAIGIVALSLLGLAAQRRRHSIQTRSPNAT